MLRLGDQPFTTGRARFHDSSPGALRGATNRVYVKLAVNGVEEPFLALLDTGAEFSILQRELAEEIGLTEAEGEPLTMKHKEGRTRGKLVRTTITMLADEGLGLDVDATVFVPDDSSLGNFIGYGGLLERVRLGLDPQENTIYFGGYDVPVDL